LRFRERSSGTTSKRMRSDARRFDGSPFPAEVRFRPMLVQEGNWVVTTIRDLTDSLQAEERRRLLEAQLLQSQKMEAMGTLAGGIAHDFNNVLATIVVNLELARDSLQANAKADDFLDEIGFATDHATQLVRRILAFSRQEETQKALIPLHRPLEQAVALLRTLLPAGAELSITLEPSSPKVFADVNQLQQVLMNLGTNAWHALNGQPGRITIIQDQVSVVASENPDQLRPGRYARIVVSDTGSGIDQRTLQRIFEPFFTTKPAGKGTGLGLAMVHGIMRDHDGNVTVESLPGEGASFTLLLPTVEGLTDAVSPSRPLAQVSPGQRILVVDGEPALVRAASRFFGKLGYSVSGHHDAKEALVAFASDPFDFDVLVADTGLHDMQGLALARSMLELRPELPILLVTAELNEGEREAARGLGIREIMQKPYGLAELSDAILRTAARAASR
jgi:signal transduction histidine kinase/ActR/RegA family two-component response regulator